MNQKHFLSLLILALIASAPLSAHASETLSSDHSQVAILGVLIILLVLGVVGASYWLYQRYILPEPVAKPEDAFCEHRITQTFISALPSLSRELNLEVATTRQTETLERSDTKRVLGINLGTNTAQIRMPVTYRYHVRISDPWSLSIRGKAVMVHAPMIRPSQPPAIHTDQMHIETKRGWCRPTPYEMADQLHHDLTPTLCEYAHDPQRLQFIKETARQSVARLVRLWLERENRWNRFKFTSIHVQFRDEKELPMASTLQLLNQVN